MRLLALFLVIALASLFLAVSPEVVVAADDMGCVCSGSIGLNTAGKMAAPTVMSNYGITEAQLQSSCEGLGGAYTDFECANASLLAAGIKQSDCSADALTQSIMSQFGIPSEAQSFVNNNVECAWKMVPDGIKTASNLTAASAVGSGQASGSGSGSAGNSSAFQKNVDCPKGTPPGTTCLKNPLRDAQGNSATDIPTLIGSIIKVVLGIVGSVTIFVMISGAKTWLLSGGNPEKVSAGAATMLWAALGVFLVLASYFAVTTYISFLQKPF